MAQCAALVFNIDLWPLSETGVCFLLDTWPNAILPSHYTVVFLSRFVATEKNRKTGKDRWTEEDTWPALLFMSQSDEKTSTESFKFPLNLILNWMILNLILNDIKDLGRVFSKNTLVLYVMSVCVFVYFKLKHNFFDLYGFWWKVALSYISS